MKYKYYIACRGYRGYSYFYMGIFYNSDLSLKTEEGIRKAAKDISDSENCESVIFLNITELEG